MKGRNRQHRGLVRKTWRWSKRILKVAIALVVAYVMLWTIFEIMDWLCFGIPLPFGFDNSVIRSKVAEEKSDVGSKDLLDTTSLITQLPTDKAFDVVKKLPNTILPVTTEVPNVSNGSLPAKVILTTDVPKRVASATIESVTTTPIKTSKILVTSTPCPTSTPYFYTNTPSVTNTPKVTITPYVTSMIQKTSPVPQHITTKPNSEKTQRPVTLATFTPTPEPITGEFFVTSIVLTKEKFEEILANKGCNGNYTIENSVLKLKSETESTLINVTIYKETFEKMYEERVFIVEMPYKKISLLSIWQQLRETNTDRVELVWFVQDDEYKLKCIYKNNHFDWLYTLLSGERYEIIE